MATRVDTVPARAGIGLRAPHHAQAQQGRVADWLEVHPENFLADAEAERQLELIRRDHPLSLHAVGLSLGSAEGVDLEQLARLRALCARLQPALVSDHLSWSRVDGVFFSDLLPLPYDAEALQIVTDNVGRAQDALGRALLIENPSTYLRFAHSEMTEAEFLAALVSRSGCGVLFDVNNVYVTAMNQGRDPSTELAEYLRLLPAGCVAEIHLAGHAVTQTASGLPLRIDDHGAPVCTEVWALYRQALSVLGAVPTLIEWDSRLPPLARLQQEARSAQQYLDRIEPQNLDRPEPRRALAR